MELKIEKWNLRSIHSVKQTVKFKIRIIIAIIIAARQVGLEEKALAGLQKLFFENDNSTEATKTANIEKRFATM